MIPSMTLPDGSPNPDAAMVGAVICSAIYHNQPALFAPIAAAMGARVLGSRIDLAAFEPDYVVMYDGATVLIVYDGTTNFAQWMAHIGGSISPVSDPNLGGELTLQSFRDGNALVAPEVMALALAVNPVSISLVGHSYGAAAAFILSRYFGQSNPAVPVDLLTFGEPKSYTTQASLYMPRSHNRLVGCALFPTEGFPLRALSVFDPVTFCPPAAMTYVGDLKTLRILKTAILGRSWQHFGQEWWLAIGSIQRGGTNVVTRFSPLELAAFIHNASKPQYHFMDQCYLTFALNAYARAGSTLAYYDIAAIGFRLRENPATAQDFLSPPLSSASINDAFFAEVGVITDFNRTNFSVVVSSGQVLFPRSEGVSQVAITPFQLPTFKGTFFNRILNGGFSLSLYAANPPSPSPGPPPAPNAPTSYSAMMAAMLAMKPFRSKLSITPFNGVATNPLLYDAIRVEDERVLRDSLLNTTLQNNDPGYFSSDPRAAPQLVVASGSLQNENDDLDSAFHVRLSDGNGHNADLYIHGVPILALSTSASGVPPIGTMARTGPQVTSTWLNNLVLFCNNMVSNGLGFRFAYTTWTPVGQPQGGYPTLGNGTPVSCWYNFPSTPNNTYTFGMASSAPAPLPFSQTNGINIQQLLPGTTTITPAPPAILGKFVAIVRTQKQMRVINGRWPALGFYYAGSSGPPVIPAGYYVNINRRAANYLTSTNGVFDNNGTIAPEVWSVVQPAPGGPPFVSTLPPGIQLLELTSKKVGRPFEEQRGRRRATVV